LFEFAIAKIKLLYSETGKVSIVSKKKSATAKNKKKGPHFYKPLAQYLTAKIDSPSAKITATEISEVGGLSQTHISDLKNGNKPPENATVGTLVKLADGMGESAVTLFNLARGEAGSDPQEERLRQILRDYARLDEQQRAELDAEFLLKELRNRIKRKLHSNA
jgi:transcriptional regulator with XRE-family HTH domain